MKIRNDDRLAYREGRFEEIEPEVLDYLKSLEPIEKEAPKSTKRSIFEPEQEKGE